MTTHKKTLGQWFERGTRNNGEHFVTLRDGHPEWLQEAIYAAHDDALPSDWVYEECRAACDAIDEGSLQDDDALHEHADGRVDVYTRELFQWAADWCASTLYANAEEEAKELGGEEASIEDRLRTIQYCVIRSIAGTMLRAWEEHKGDEETEGEEAQP